jgi:1-acyl-sn-glycerol-3-phosphate acyltransferase
MTVREDGPGTDLRPYLPGLESERQITDWGRSERVEGLLDRTLVEFFYRLWFRCEVQGIENVPADGGALLVSNHAGALPPDAAMIAKAIKEEHPHPRPVHLTVEHFFKGYPGFSMLLPKVGAVPAHPANVHRLLYDEGQLVLVFPEGRKGTEKLFKDRYRLRRFGRGGFVEAALDAGIIAATLVHPWNRELCETEDVICGADWHELARNLAPVLA